MRLHPPARDRFAGPCPLTLFALAVVAQAAVLLWGAGDGRRLRHRSSSATLLLRSVRWLASMAVLAVTAGGATFRALRQGGPGVAGRVHGTAVVAGLVRLRWLCQQWNLLGWRYG